MEKESLPVSEAQKRILETLRVEFFPLMKELKDILIRVQATKIFFGIYSPTFSKLEQDYFSVSEKLFAVDRKLTTPDILFDGLPNMTENIMVYYQHQIGVKESLSEFSRYIEITDRTLDRKRQTLQNNRTFLVALVALLVPLWQNIWPINIGNFCSGATFSGEKLTRQQCAFVIDIGDIVDLKWDTSHDVQ